MVGAYASFKYIFDVQPDSDDVWFCTADWYVRRVAAAPSTLSPPIVSARTPSSSPDAATAAVFRRRCCGAPARDAARTRQPRRCVSCCHAIRTRRGTSALPLPRSPHFALTFLMCMHASQVGQPYFFPARWLFSGNEACRRVLRARALRTRRLAPSPASIGLGTPNIPTLNPPHV